jgi:hypothetical protein
MLRLSSLLLFATTCVTHGTMRFWNEFNWECQKVNKLDTNVWVDFLPGTCWRWHPRERVYNLAGGEYADIIAGKIYHVDTGCYCMLFYLSYICVLLIFEKLPCSKMPIALAAMKQ